jgi:hypothetical protein
MTSHDPVPWAQHTLPGRRHSWHGGYARADLDEGVQTLERRSSHRLVGMLWATLGIVRTNPAQEAASVQVSTLPSWRHRQQND